MAEWALAPCLAFQVMVTCLSWKQLPVLAELEEEGGGG